MKNKDELEKVYITRDEFSDTVIIWRKPKKGIWKPESPKKSECINYQRSDRNLDNVDFYTENDFINKFGTKIKQKKIININIKKSLLDNDDYKMFSKNPNRKK